VFTILTDAPLLPTEVWNVVTSETDGIDQSSPLVIELVPVPDKENQLYKYPKQINGVVGVGVTVLVGVTVGVLVCVGVTVGSGVLVGVGEILGVLVFVGVGVGDPRLGVTVGVGVGEGQKLLPVLAVKQFEQVS